ncbi:MAG: transglutaminase [Muribaculaceae bacterium]|nr:transglutaminase [Muribaculaceae bacterium]
MKHRKDIYMLFLLMTMMLCCCPITNAKTTDEVVIDDCQDVYEFKIRKGEIVVNNKIALNYVLLKQFKCNIQPSIFYGDNIKFVKSSCSRSRVPEHKSITPDNVFYDDSKACFYDVTLDSKHQKCEAKFERDFTDIHYFSHIVLADEFFIRHKIVKIIIPDELQNYKLIGKNITPNIHIDETHEGNKRIITYTIINQPAVKEEDNMPNYAKIYPTIMIAGAYANVDELYGWSHELSQVDTTIPTLNSILHQMPNANNNLDKMKNTYSWVQSNIRYVAFEAGISKHQPDTPSEVVRKRYGDCKGLALLLKTLLVAQGIDAHLVYLGTKSVSCHISEIPSLASMNHVICAVNLDGKTYYLDPTNNYIPIEHIPNNIQGVEALIENGAGYKMVTLPTLPIESSCDSLYVNMSLVDGVLKGDAERWVKGDMKEMMLTAYNDGESQERNSFISLALNDNAHSLKVNNPHWVETSSAKEWACLQGEILDEHSLTKLDDEIYIELDPDNMTQGIIDTTKREHSYVFPISCRRVNEVHFTIPAGYHVEKLPSPVNIKTAAGVLGCTFVQKGNSVVFVKTIDITGTELLKEELNTWNNNIRHWNEACHEQLVLKPIK